MPAHPAQTFDDLVPYPAVRRARPHRFADAHTREQGGGREEGQRVEEHRGRRGERLHQETRERRTGDLRNSARSLEPAVRGDELTATNERRHERRPCGFRGDGEDARKERHDVQLRQAEDAERGRGGH